MSENPLFARSTDACLKKYTELPPEDEAFIYVFAPVICSYVTYVLRDAHDRGIKRLVFLARDGYLPYIAALKLAPVIAPEIELSIVSVSRYALRSAEYGLMGKECLDTICLGALNLTFAKMMKRASLTEEEIEKVAEKCGMIGRVNDVLTHKQIRDIKEKLREVPEFFEMVKVHSDGKLKSVSDYLKQEGLTKERVNDTCIVDSGWIGTVQRSINKIVGGEDKGFEGYYFGLYSIPSGASPDAYRSYYISPGSGLSDLLRKVRFSICLFKSICSSPESMTYGYEYSDGKVKPVTDECGNPNVGFIRRALVYLEDYSKVLASEDLKHIDNNAMLKMCEKLLKLCMGNPTKEESEALGKFSFSDDVVEDDMKRLAAKWGREELKDNSFFRKMFVKAGLKTGKVPVSGWPEGSIAASSDGLRKKFGLMSERCLKAVTEIRKTVIK